MNKHYIWVRITGGVMGFTPDEIVEYEVVFDIKLKPYGFTYWDGFNLYFDDVLDIKEATGFSALWHDDEAWKQLEHLRTIK